MDSRNAEKNVIKEPTRIPESRFVSGPSDHTNRGATLGAQQPVPVQGQARRLITRSGDSFASPKAHLPWRQFLKREDCAPPTNI